MYNIKNIIIIYNNIKNNLIIKYYNIKNNYSLI